MAVAYFKGRFVAMDSATVPINNRNFLYGDGLFESIRCMNGMPLFMSHHVDRLKTGLDILKLKTDFTLTEEILTEKITELNKLNDHTGGARIRLVIGRDQGATYAPDDLNSSLYIISTPLPYNQFMWPEKGLHVVLFEDIKKPVNALSGFKSCNSLLYVMASVYFNEKKADDSLLLNVHDRLCEGSSSNLFWIKNKQLFTVPLSEGCINGVLRTLLITHIGAIEKPCTISELINADEVFLTNMGTGLRWIKQFNEKEYGCEATKLIFENLNQILPV